MGNMHTCEEKNRCNYEKLEIVTLLFFLLLFVIIFIALHYFEERFWHIWFLLSGPSKVSSKPAHLNGTKLEDWRFLRTDGDEAV
jgi:hypothetical protein